MKAAASLIALLFFAAGGAGAPAEPAAGEAKPPAAKRGPAAEVLALYDDLRFEEADREAERLLKAGGLRADDVADLLRVRGMIAAAAGRTKQAFEAFQRLLALRPGEKLPDDTSPKVQKLFDRAVAWWADREPFRVSHVPPKEAKPGAAVPLKVTGLSDPVGLARRVRLAYRPPGPGLYRHLDAELVGWSSLSIPPDALAGTPAAVEYYLDVLDEYGNVMLSFGDADGPIRTPPGAVVKRYAAGTVGLPKGKGGPGPGFLIGPKPGGGDPGGGKPKGPAFLRKWWFWTIIGGTVAAGVTAAVVFAPRPPTHSDLFIEFYTDVR